MVETQGQEQQFESRLADLRVLLLDALVAARYLPVDTRWHSHYTGEVVYFADRVFGDERPAVLVLADEVTNDIITDSVTGDFRSYVIVGATLSPDVDLGKSRIERLKHAESLNEHYWATFILQDAILVTLGTPLSWCRLIGEILNAHMPAPFVQRRVCAYCHALNEYSDKACKRCNKQLMATGRLE
ncbi:MAG: hypothetical protein JXB30_14975 [Anaerolineae bacterium]|nr:hypothetical protein [Anaerolineae bacterium]